MERDIFIIAVYSLVAEMMLVIEKIMPLRSRGFAPQCTDAEVITLESCGSFSSCTKTERFISTSNNIISIISRTYPRARRLSGKRRIDGKSKLPASHCSSSAPDNNLMRCNPLTRSRCRSAPTRAVGFGIGVFPPAPIGGMARPNR